MPTGPTRTIDVGSDPYVPLAGESRVSLMFPQRKSVEHPDACIAAGLRGSHVTVYTAGM